MPPNDSTAVVAAEDPKTFPGMLVAFKAQIAAALPKHITADRMARIALTAYRLNPGLAKCEPASVFAAVIQSSQLGLEIGLNGRAYLVPYYNNKKQRTECQFIPGWKGLVELANRTGRCAVWTGAVFKGDEFDYQLGDNPFVTHKPGSEDDPKALLYVYAVGRIKGNEYPVVEVWPIEKVRRHFVRYNKVGEKHYALDNWEMYARKVPLLQVLKYMPASPELEAAMAMEHAAMRGAQDLNIKDAIDGSFFAPPADDEEEPPEATGGNQGVKDKLKKKAADKVAPEEPRNPEDRVRDDQAPANGKPLDKVVGEKLRKAAAAKDVDLLDAHATLIIDAPPEHQAELKALYQELRSGLVPA